MPVSSRTCASKSVHADACITLASSKASASLQSFDGTVDVMMSEKV